MALTLHGTVADNTVVLSRRNANPLIINGDMQVAQRGTSTTGITTSGYYTVDRFAVTISALGTWTQTQDTTVPTAKGFTKSLKMDCTTADASPAAGDLVLLSYKVEAQDLQLLKYGTSSAEAFTLRFHVRSPKTGTHIVHIYQNDGNRHISKAYTISSADTYQEVIINIPGDTGGTVNNDNACGMQIEFYLAAGSNSTSGTLATSWAGYAQANSAVGQVNCADSTDNNFFITGLQMEVGEFDANSIAPFQHELFGDSLQRCQRYFQTIDCARANAGSLGHVESSQVQTFLALAVKPRILAQYQGSGTLTKVGDIAINSFPSNGNTVTGIVNWMVIGNTLIFGMTTSDTIVNGSSEPVRYGSSNGQRIFTLDTEL